MLDFSADSFFSPFTAFKTFERSINDTRPKIIERKHNYFLSRTRLDPGTPWVERMRKEFIQSRLSSKTLGVRERGTQMMRSSLLLTVIALVSTAALVFDVIGSQAQESRLLRTAQMWGSEVAEGKVSASVGIAGECMQRADRTLTCQFNSIEVSQDGLCVVSTWSERLRLVRRTSDIVTWAGTRGPTGLAGVLTTSTLTAQRSAIANSKTDFFNTTGPGAFDGWSYKFTASFSAPSLGGKTLPPVSTEVKSGSSQPSLRCTNTTIMAVSPFAED